MASSERGSTFKIGVDIGGTFTDWVMIDEAGAAYVVKTPTTPAAYEGVFDAMRLSGVDGSRMRSFAHGTTLGTNALIERTLPRIAMVTTGGLSGFLTQAARGTKEDIWDIYHESPLPSIVPPRDRLEVEERVLADGTIRTGLNQEQALKIARIVRRRGIQDIAVCFLHSYANGENERRMKEILLEEHPEAMVVTSHETSPRILEYERFTTTILNVGLMRLMSEYVSRLEDGMREAGYPHDILIAQSGGGLMGTEAIRRVPIRTANSGPSAGAIAAREIGGLAGFPNVIGLDIGGTSTDVSVAEDGKLRTTESWHVEWGHPILFPAVDIITVGAGGGSLAWFDGGGKLRNGPRSAGANPGPACYMRGGTEPTNTDAHMVIGNLRAGGFLKGAMEVDPQLAEQVVADKVAKRLGLGLAESADAILALAEANMANAIRLATLRRGLDPRDFAMVAFGGAGPLHGARVARELSIPHVVVPPHPGLTSAIGCLLADIRHDSGKSMFYEDIEKVRVDEVEEMFQEIERRLEEALGRENIPEAQRTVERTVDMCYSGQWRVLSIALDGRFSDASLRDAASEFHQQHKRMFDFNLPERPIEIHGINVTGVGITDKYHIRKVTRAEGDLAERAVERDVYWREVAGWVKTPVFQREGLSTGDEFEGPAIVEQLDSTTLVPPSAQARVDEYGNLVLALG